MSTFKKSLVLSSVILTSSISSYVQAAPFGLEARSLGMGNIGVATADIATAAFANPAMLSYQPFKEDFSTLFTVGGLLDDSGGMIDAIDDFQAANSQLNSSSSLSTDPFLVGSTQAVDNFNAQITDTNNMFAAADSLNGKVLSPQFGAALVVGFSFEEYSFAVSARTDLVAAGGLSAISSGPAGGLPTISAGASDVATLAAINAADIALTNLSNDLQDPTQNILTIEGIQTTEVGLSVAKNFRWHDRKISIGVTPKIVNAERTSFSESIVTSDTGLSGLTDEDLVTDLGDFVTMDVGAVVELSESTQIGLVIKNVMEETIIDGLDEIVFSRQAKVGVAYRADFFTIGADLDLIEADPVLSGAVFQSQKTKMLNIGAEINAWDFLQLRVGMQQNMSAPAGVEDQLLTAGIGLWLGFNLDAGVMVGDDVLGAMLQLGFKF